MFRTVVTGIFCVYLFFIVKPILNNFNENSIFRKILIACLSILLTTSCLGFLMRTYAICINDNIGLYEETSLDQFSKNIAINYLIDLIIAVLTSICLSFVYKSKIF